MEITIARALLFAVCVLFSLVPTKQARGWPGPQVYIILLRVNQKNICEHAKNLLTMLVLFGIIYIENERKVMSNDNVT